MKRSEVKQLGEHLNPPAVEPEPEPEQELVFTRFIGASGDLRGDPIQPSDWDHVAHLYGRLYLAWDGDGMTTHVCVGEYRDPKS